MRLIRVCVMAVAASAFLGDPASAAVTSEKIVFASDRDGDYDIYSMDTDGANVVQLTNAPGPDIHPAIAPNGTRIAYNRDGGVNEHDTWLMNADGSDQHLFAASAEDPTWTPDSAKIVFGSIGHSLRDGDIYAMNADGSGQADAIAYSDRDNLEPALSADGTKIAWIGQIDDYGVGEGLFTANIDGTGRVNHSSFEPNDHSPDWSPDSTKLAFFRGTVDGGICLMNRDGTGLQCLGAGGSPSWSPSGAQIAFVSGRDGNAEIYKMNSDGTAQTRLTNNPASDIDPDWGVLSNLTGPGYPRPKGASPLRMSLVPANQPCTAPNRTHGSLLAFPSCAPPHLTSLYLTTGTPDSNGVGRPAWMNASLTLEVQPGDSATLADESDVTVKTRVNDVLTKALADYTGELHANLPIRITDRDNLPSVGGPGPGTTQPFAFGFDVPCSPTVETNMGSNCTLTTTIDTLVPGAIKETRRAIWQVGQVRVFDGGADGDGSTAADNTVFAAQGVFVPQWPLAVPCLLYT
jgi:Tol biopolymer transport system component